MTDKPIEDVLAAMRKHIEMNKAKERAPFTVAGLSMVLAEIDRLRAAQAEPVRWQRRSEEEGHGTWLLSQDGWIDARPEDVEHYRARGDEIRALYAAPPAPQADVPAGWQLVPIKPTDDMLDAALAVHEARDDEDKEFFDEFRRTYRAMLSGAPAPQPHVEGE